MFNSLFWFWHVTPRIALTRHLCHRLHIKLQNVYDVVYSQCNNNSESVEYFLHILNNKNITNIEKRKAWLLVVSVWIRPISWTEASILRDSPMHDTRCYLFQLRVSIWNVLFILRPSLCIDKRSRKKLQVFPCYCWRLKGGECMSPEANLK